MAKTEKKEEKKKSGRTKDAPKEVSVTQLSEKLERAFNKKMKGVVKEVKKDTKKAIKNIMLEARQKIKDSAALIMQDLIKNAEPTPANTTTPETEQPVIAAGPIANALDDNNQPATSETSGQEENKTALTPASPKKIPSRVRKTKATTGTASADTKPTRTRKPAAARANVTDTSANENV